MVKLCETAKANGIHIIRDVDVMRSGDRISRFMKQIGRGQKIFVILSEKYLKSPYCMYELHEIYTNCRQDDEEFLRRVQVFSLPCAKIYDALDRNDVDVFWRTKLNKYDERIRDQGVDAIGDLTDHATIVRRFANNTSRILALVADTLHPTAIEQIEQLRLE